MNGVLNLAGTDYELEDGCGVRTIETNSTIKWQYRIEIRR